MRYLNDRSSLGFLFALLIAVTIIVWQWQFVAPHADDPTLLEWSGLPSYRPKADWSPFFVGLLRLLRVFIIDEVQVYKAAVSIISLASWGLLCGWLIQLTANKRMAFSVSLFFLISGLSPAAATVEQYSLIVSSVAGHAALCFVLLGLIIIWRDHRSLSLPLASVSFILATYCRPEFLAVAIFCTGAALWTAILVSANRQRSVTYALLVFPVWAFLIWLWGFPAPNGTRAFVAFGQHTGLGFCWAYPSVCQKNTWLFWQDYMSMLYPGASTVLEVALRHPFGFAEHVARNAMLLVINIAIALFDAKGISPISRIGWLVGFLLVATVIFIVGSSRSNLTDARQSARYLPIVIAIVAIGPQFANCFLLYPRLHYLVAPVVVVLGLAFGYFLPRAKLA